MRIPATACLIAFFTPGALCMSFTGMATAEPVASITTDAATGRIISASDATDPIHPGRLTQMMTLYVASEAIASGKISRSDLVTVSDEAASQRPVILGLEAGERIPLGTLIDTLTIHGPRDAALAIAEAVAGSETAFVRRMNTTARAMCMTGTIFMNATGTNMPGHYSSAADLATLARHVLHDDPALFARFGRSNIRFRGRLLANRLERLRRIEAGTDGILTAYSPAGGFSIAATAVIRDRRVIAVVIGDQSEAQRNTATLQLMRDALAAIPTRTRIVPPDLDGCKFTQQHHRAFSES